MAKEFTFNPAEFIPFRDKEVLDRVRNIRKEDIAKHPNPDVEIKVVDDHLFDAIVATEMLKLIMTTRDAGEKCVFILSQPEPLYTLLAIMLNTFRVDCSHLYTFNMDEWASDEGKIAPPEYPPSFFGAYMKNFYAALDESLRPPVEQLQCPTDKNFKDYGKMITDVGGADLCTSGPGWTGHLAFIDPNAPEFATDDLEEWKQMGPRIVTLNPFTVAQNSLHGSFGASGDMANVPPKAATIGPAQVIESKWRIDMNNLQTCGTFSSWQRFMTRLVIHGPVTPLVPTSILQELKTLFLISETCAADVEPRTDIYY